MTSEDKKERKVLRAMLMKRVERTLSVDLRLRCTPAQVKAHCRKLVDQILAGKNPYEVQRIA